MDLFPESEKKGPCSSLLIPGFVLVQNLMGNEAVACCLSRHADL